MLTAQLHEDCSEFSITTNQESWIGKNNFEKSKINENIFETSITYVEQSLVTLWGKLGDIKSIMVLKTFLLRFLT